MTHPHIVILGGGPTGLGAALRLTELGREWELLDAAPSVGGLSRSFTDDKGFTWDLGGHVIFSHYAYFDDAMDLAVGEWNHLERESWVWVCGVWVPYPFQNNIHRLPNPEKQRALEGLIDVHRVVHDAPPRNFEDMFVRQMGDGIADLFMRPYNLKVWAFPPTTMSTEWTGERVAAVDLKRVCRNVVHNTDDLGWGPNATFRFPQEGGTGSIWASLASKLPQDRFRLGPDHTIVGVRLDRKEVITRAGRVVPYDALISTIPLDDLLRMATSSTHDISRWPQVADGLVYSATHVVGVGIKGSPPPHLRTKCWMYFPESSSPFYRATVFSNYAAANAPAGHWSLMLEVSESSHKPVNRDTLLTDCIEGCIASTLISPTDEVVSRWHHHLPKGYPTPFLGRNELLDTVHPTLEAARIYSRGRFGGWKYEVANQDHSMMQGVECVDAILGLGAESTFPSPSRVNATKDTTKRLSTVNLASTQP